jgi:hypothetical protein
MSDNRFQYGLLAVTAAVLLGLSTFAAADEPRTDRVLATFGVTTIEGAFKERTCTGEDGEYVERHDEFEGPVDSTDPRLNGTLEVKTDALINTTTGEGTIHGTWSVRDEITNDLQLTGRFNGVVTDLFTFEGLAWARISGGSGGVLVANLNVHVLGNTATGTIGFPLSTSLSSPAVIQSGSCSGGFGPPL